MDSIGDSLLYILGGLIVTVLLFLVLRELFCWYSKVNERIKNQKEIIFLLKKLLDRLPENELQVKDPIVKAD